MRLLSVRLGQITLRGQVVIVDWIKPGSVMFERDFFEVGRS